MRTLKSILLAGALLLATPVFFSSCEEDGSLIKFKTEVQVVNDFNDVVKAINDGKLSSEQAIAQLVTAIDNIKGDQSAKLQAIADALSNNNNTLDTKLNVIAGAMKSLSTEMPTKIDALAKAVENMPKYEEVLEAVKTALVNINPNEQLKLLEGVLDKYFSDELKYPDSPLSYKGKLYYCIAELENTMDVMTYKSDKFKAIRKAIEKLAGENAKLDGILDDMTKIVEAIKAGNTNEKEGWAEFAKLLAQLKEDAGIGGGGGGTTTEDGKPMPSGCVDLGLPSGILWGKYNLGTIFPSEPGDYYAWGEIETKKKYSDNYKFYGKSSIVDGGIKYNRRDGKMVLELEDDAANVVLGVGYRIPTKEDWQELLDECKWEAETFTYPIEWDPTQKKIITKWKVTGPNGNYIILPNSGGYKFEKGYENEDYTYYTTSTLRPRNEFYGINDWLNDMTAWKVKWYIEAKETSDGNFEKPNFDDKVRRMCGFVIRPVFDFYANK